MRTTIITLLLLTIIGCEKDKVAPLAPPINYYQSQGNFLILVIGDTLDYAYEYNLGIIQFTNDSLPIETESVSDGFYPFTCWKLTPNPDTLLWNYNITSGFMEEQISGDRLLSLNSSLSYDSNQFQIVFPGPNIDVESSWDQVSHLEIVKEYRESTPNSKIAISRQVLWFYDEELGFTIPYEKHLIFLAK